MKKLTALYRLQKALSKKARGFTLVELLVVIAILGVLGGIILVAIDPVEQLKRSRDTGRKQSVSQLGRALQAYFTSNNGVYPPETSWVTNMKDFNEIKVIPNNPAYTGGMTSGCPASGTGIEGNYCYDQDATPETIVYARLESAQDGKKCPNTTDIAWVAWSSVNGGSGTTCTANATTVPAVGTTLSFK